MIRIIFIIAIISLPLSGFCQKPPEDNTVKKSELSVAYDTLYQRVTGSGIPFDKHFSLRIPVRKGTQVKVVDIYRADIRHDKRILLRNVSGNMYSKPDMKRSGVIQGDTAIISFPPMKPSRIFDIAVKQDAGSKTLQGIYDINEALYKGDMADARKKFDDAVLASKNDVWGINTLMFDNFTDYRLFYSARLSVSYRNLHNDAAMVRRPLPDMADINRVSRRLIRDRVRFPDMKRLVDVLQDNNADAVSTGLFSIKYGLTADPAKATDYAVRIANLGASITFLDTLSNAIEACLAISNESDIAAIRKMVKEYAEGLELNRGFLQDGMKEINKAVTKDNRIMDMDVILGTTVARDIKTAGGNQLTLDFGMVNILTRNMTHGLAYIPKPYYGLNIYLRPVDRNTRGRYIHRRYPDAGDGTPNSLASVNNFWMHFSICVGLTIGPMPSGQFDYLLNNSALLFGGGYRIGRFFKINSGLALLKRSNYNPLVSEKRVIGGFFVATSFDVDLVQGVKDFTAKIWP